MITNRQATTLKDVLRERRMTQRALAVALSRPDATVNKWANGLTPSESIQEEICAVLNTGPYEPLKPVDIWGGPDV